MGQSNEIKFKLESYFLFDHYSIRLSEKFNERIWFIIERNKQFRTFLQNCLDNIEKQTNLTGQHISGAKVTVRVFNKNCNEDQIVCKDIDVTFHTVEGTSKSYEFKDRINLSDFYLKTDILKTGLMRDLIKKEVRNINNTITFLECSFILGAFVCPCVVLGLAVEKGGVITESSTLKILFAFLIGVASLLFYKQWRASRKGNKAYNLLISKTGTNWVFP